MLVSDSGPQYAAEEFKLFATDLGFTHVTTSPRYPQANGTAKRGVQTAKNILKKNSNPLLRTLGLPNSTHPQWAHSISVAHVKIAKDNASNHIRSPETITC